MPTTLGEDGTVILTGCDWKGCDHTDTLVEVGHYVWCVCHLVDDFIPLHSGVRAFCAQCDTPTIWHAEDGTPLHNHCVRWWLMKREGWDAPTPAPAAPRGAYARRGAPE